MLGKLAATAALLVSLPLGLATAVGAQGAATGCRPLTSSGPVGSLDAQQAGNARLIVAVGQQRGVPERGLLVALMTAMQESTLRNLDYGDRDSLGLFQQRPSVGWGSPAQLLDPAYAAAAFFGGPGSPTGNLGLLDVASWEQMPLTLAAQAVQRSAFPDAYARWEAPARAWLAEILDRPGLDTGTCSPTTTTGTAAVVIAEAARWLGTPYVWGGGNADGPTEGIGQGAGAVGFDCSGLTLYAYAQVGVTLPRTSREQWGVPGLRIRSLADLQPGDLVFFATNPADPATIHHVAISLGSDAMIHAPTTGEAVQITTAISENAYWAGQFIGGLRIMR